MIAEPLLHSEEYDKPSHVLVFSLCFQFSCYSYNFHFVFNSLNSASAEGASTLNDVAVIVVYSYAQLQLHYLHFLMTLNIL